MSGLCLGARFFRVGGDDVGHGHLQRMRQRPRGRSLHYLELRSCHIYSLTHPLMLSLIQNHHTNHFILARIALSLSLSLFHSSIQHIFTVACQSTPVAIPMCFLSPFRVFVAIGIVLGD